MIQEFDISQLGFEINGIRYISGRDFQRIPDDERIGSGKLLKY